MLNLLLSSAVFLLKSTGALSQVSAACCLWLSFPLTARSLLVGAELACYCPSAIPAPYIFTIGSLALMFSSYFPVLLHLFIEILSFCEGQQTYFPSL